MIDETRDALTSIGTKLDVSFILLANQQNVYDEFIKYLNEDGSAQPDAVTTRKSDVQESISYDEKGKTRARKS